MKKYLVGASLVILGFILGSLFTGWLASRASIQYLDSTRAVFLLEQQVLAARASVNKQPLWEIVHYKNIVDLLSPRGIRTFEKTSSRWPTVYPFVAPVLADISEHSDPSGIGRRRIEGLNRGYLALALDNFGLKHEAEIEWRRAIELNNVKDVEKFKSSIHSQKINQSRWLEFEGQYTYTTE